MRDYYIHKSLDELEKEEWKNPDLLSSLVKKVSSIRKKPIKDLTVEDIRLMVGQQFSLDYIVPLALKFLEKNPFVEGDFYEGDLLVNMLSIKQGFWDENFELYKVFRQIIKSAYIKMDDLKDKNVQRKIKEVIKEFDHK